MASRTRARAPAREGLAPLTLDDLDRDELRELIGRLGFGVTQRQLWSIRWGKLSDKASAAALAQMKAEEAHFDAQMKLIDARGRGGKGELAALTAANAAEAARDRAERAAARTRSAEKAAFAELERFDAGRIQS